MPDSPALLPIAGILPSGLTLSCPPHLRLSASRQLPRQEPSFTTSAYYLAALPRSPFLNLLHPLNTKTAHLLSWKRRSYYLLKTTSFSDSWQLLPKVSLTCLSLSGQKNHDDHNLGCGWAQPLGLELQWPACCIPWLLFIAGLLEEKEYRWHRKLVVSQLQGMSCPRPLGWGEGGPEFESQPPTLSIFFSFRLLEPGLQGLSPLLLRNQCRKQGNCSGSNN
jgi:hypothetical protein